MFAAGTVQEPCRVCHGTGLYAGYYQCGHCGGRKVFDVPACGCWRHSVCTYCSGRLHFPTAGDCGAHCDGERDCEALRRTALGPRCGECGSRNVTFTQSAWGDAFDCADCGSRVFRSIGD